MDIYVRFFLSLLNARSPCRDCNSAIIPRLRTTYRTISAASSYFCRTSGPHAGPILQQISCKTAAQNHTQDQFRSKLVFLPHFRSTHRTNSAASSMQNQQRGPHAGPVPQHLPRKTKESRDDSRLPYCVLCNVSGRYAVTCILASLRASLAYDLLTHPA